MASGSFLLSFPARGGFDRRVLSRWTTNETLAACKLPCPPAMGTKVAVEFLFEAVLGKTAVQNSRGEAKTRRRRCALRPFLLGG